MSKAKDPSALPPFDEVRLITRDDLICAFRLWAEAFELEPETVDEVLARNEGKDFATMSADTLLGFLDEAFDEPHQ